jgi:ubiquinone/menaquinone biosynthesis C-methylase UbiE
MLAASVLVLLLAPQVEHQHHPPRSAEEYAKALESSSREKWQKPRDVVEALKLKADEVIADIGTGSGYFSRRFAHHAGKVLAVDIDARLLELTGKDKPGNLETVLAATDDPKLPDGSVDTIFFCNVLHHIDNRPAYYAKLDRALKAGGRIVIVDFYKKKLPVGPPPSMKLTAEQVESELQAAGFRRTASHNFLPYQYFLEFQR